MQQFRLGGGVEASGSFTQYRQMDNVGQASVLDDILSERQPQLPQRAASPLSHTRDTLSPAPSIGAKPSRFAKEKPKSIKWLNTLSRKTLGERTPIDQDESRAGNTGRKSQSFRWARKAPQEEASDARGAAPAAPAPSSRLGPGGRPPVAPAGGRMKSLRNLFRIRPELLEEADDGGAEPAAPLDPGPRAAPSSNHSRGSGGTAGMLIEESDLGYRNYRVSNPVALQAQRIASVARHSRGISPMPPLGEESFTGVARQGSRSNAAEALKKVLAMQARTGDLSLMEDIYRRQGSAGGPRASNSNPAVERRSTNGSVRGGTANAHNRAAGSGPVPRASNNGLQSYNSIGLAAHEGTPEKDKQAPAGQAAFARRASSRLGAAPRHADPKAPGPDAPLPPHARGSEDGDQYGTYPRGPDVYKKAGSSGSKKSGPAGGGNGGGGGGGGLFCCLCRPRVTPEDPDVIAFLGPGYAYGGL